MSPVGLLNLCTGPVLLMTLTSVTLAYPSSQAKSIKGCPEPIAPRRGTYQLSEGELSVEFFCRPGHTLIGSHEATCRNGLWSQQPPVCVGGDCNMPSIKDALMVWLHGGGIVRIKCRSGFYLTGAGSEFLACIDGQWNSSTTPQCINSKKETEAGKKSLKEANLVGKHRKSEDDGTDADKKSHEDWMQDADYSCVRSDFTVYPPSVPNARAFTRWAMHDGRPRLYTTYQCKWGFKPTAGGARNSVYCINDTWIGTTPKCQTVVYEDSVQGDILGIAPSLSHDALLLKADYSCIDAGPGGSVDPPVPDHSSSTLKFVILEGRPHLYTEYTCSDGYELQNEKRAYLYCKGKAWIGDLPKCIPAKSKYSCAVNNGGCGQLCKYNNGGLLYCSCKEGYTLQPDKATCTDFDECEVNGGDCDHLCDNTAGSFACSCFPGYKLDSDRKTCNRTEDDHIRNEATHD